jgi:hypothetical protein
MNVADWDPESVEDWALHYGFNEIHVIENIHMFHIGGKQLLSGIVTADFLGITVPVARLMFGARIDELISRDFKEEVRDASIEQVKKKARFIEADQSDLKDPTADNDAEEEGPLVEKASSIAEESEKEMAVPSNKAPKSIFRLQLEEEDRKARSAKVIPSFVLFSSLILISLQKSLLDDVSDGEGEEEEGQRGLGDFGFGSMKELREMDEEKDPLKLRRGDLDQIVDDFSYGEDDEEEEGQCGLGDFGFGTMSELREMDEEKDARKRRWDLDQIVDDLSDGEGKEEEGQRGLANLGFGSMKECKMDHEVRKVLRGYEEEMAKKRAEMERDIAQFTEDLIFRLLKAERMRA